MIGNTISRYGIVEQLGGAGVWFEGAAEGVGADASGNVYGAEVVLKRVMKYVKK
jgi:hypothetical protein